MFETSLQKGFQITFANGLTASVQWGVGNYCDNHFSSQDFCAPAKSTNAEVAVIGTDGELIDYVESFLPEGVSTDGTVAGWLSPEEVAEFLYRVSTWGTDAFPF